MAWNRLEISNFNYHICLAQLPLTHLSPTQLVQRTAWINRCSNPPISIQQYGQAVADLIVNHNYSQAAAEDHCSDLCNMLTLPHVVPLSVPFSQSDIPMVHALDTTARSMSDPAVRASTSLMDIQFHNYHRAVIQQRLSDSVDMMENWGEGGQQNPSSNQSAHSSSS